MKEIFAVVSFVLLEKNSETPSKALGQSVVYSSLSSVSEAPGVKLELFLYIALTTLGILRINRTKTDKPVSSLTPAEAPLFKSTSAVSALLCSAAT